MGIIVVGLVVAAVCGYFGNEIGKTKGMASLGLWLGLLLGPFGVLIIAVLQPTSPGRGTSTPTMHFDCLCVHCGGGSARMTLSVGTASAGPRRAAEMR